MSVREEALAALHDLLRDGLTGADVKRNADVPLSVGPGGLVILRDGDPGEPEVSLSPPLYAYEHRADLEIYIDDALSPAEVMDVLLADVGAALSGERTLFGCVDHCEPTAPTVEPMASEGGSPLLTARLGVILVYVTPSPLG